MAELNLLTKEFQYYLDHQTDLVKKYNGMFVVIKNCQIVGSYKTESEAIEDSMKTMELGTFLVQKCEPGKKSYTQTYHSRVVFA